jgi:TolB-like protein
LQRRLAAILIADVVDYSRLMGEDEARTLAALTELRRELFEPVVNARGGKVIKRLGDGWIVEFPSISDATASAIEVQEGLENHQIIRLRIGVHIGDVTFQDDDIYGDGINVAARLEALAEPGQVLISDTAHHSLDSKAVGVFDGGEEHQLKNIARSVAVWRWPAGSSTTGPEPTSLALPDKPSIAVLPFSNMSNDPEQEYFADGITEDIITALSRLNWLFVIARNSTFAFKGKATDIRKIARELGVRYVLEGSVRKSGGQLRITGQLIDATNGAHLWADKFDGTMTDVFALQDQVTESVIGAIEPSLRKAEMQRSKRKRPEKLAAYDFYLRAMPHLYAFRPEVNSEAQRLLENAVQEQPDFAPALANLAWALEQRFVHNWPDAQEDDPARAIELARRAISADRNDADATSLSGFLLTILGHDHESGLRAVERALEINPNSAMVCWTAGWVYLFCGEPDKSLTLAKRLIRLSPVDLEMHFIFNVLAGAHLFLEQFSEAAEAAAQSLDHYTELDVSYWLRIPACAHLGEDQEVAIAAAKLLELEPNFSVSGFANQVPFRNPNHMKIVLDGFRMAGLPE